VYGIASNADPTVQNYGGYFKSEGGSGSGVLVFSGGKNAFGIRAYATNSGDYDNTGGWFEARGKTGIGAMGYGIGSESTGVKGNGGKYDFYASGSGTHYGSPSSIRWKNDIIAIDNPLEKLSRIRGVYFNWDSAHGGTHDIGCIAEEVGEVLPEIVAYEENGIDADGMDYSMLTPLLIESIKALEKRVEDLENKILKGE